MNKAKDKIELIWDWKEKDFSVPETISLPLSTLASHIEEALVNTNLSACKIVNPVYTLHYKLSEQRVLRNDGYVVIPTKLASRAAIEYVQKVGPPSSYCLIAEFPTKVIIESLKEELGKYKDDIPEEKPTLDKLFKILDEALEIS